MASADHSQFQFAAERYTLGELSEEEKLAFEKHYFSCGACAQDVEDLTTLRTAAPTILKQLDREPSKRPFLSWFGQPWVAPFALGALALLVLVAGYQNAVQIPRLRAASDDSLRVMAGPRPLVAERGAGTVISGLPRTASFSITNEWPDSYPHYHARISRHGSTVSLLSAEADVSQDNLLITIPAKRLGPGTFDLTISGETVGGTPKEVALYVFKIQGEH